MSVSLAPFGFRSSYHRTGLDRAIQYQMASGYGTAIYKNEPVGVNTNGTIVSAGAGNVDVIGTLIGIDYVDATGRPVYLNYWPAGTVSTGPINCWVSDDLNEVFEVQADGPIPQTAIFDQANVTNAGTGSTTTGRSTCTLGPPVGAGTQGQFRIVGFAKNLDNSVSDAYPIVQVMLARSPYAASKVAV